MQTHRPRTVSCPVCGDTRFGSTTNAIQHIETGSCSGCRGASNARDAIYKFVSATPQFRSVLSDQKRIAYGGTAAGAGTPTHPYSCQECGKSCKQFSQLMQHMTAKHGRDDRVLNSGGGFLRLQ
jgi:hypothetical protein